MSYTWKFLPLAVMAALGAFMLVSGSPGSPGTPTARADYDCSEGEWRLRIIIYDDDLDDEVDVAGSQVIVEPDPDGVGGSKTLVDNGSNDDNDSVGIIDFDETCETTEDDVYTLTLDELPEELEDCQIDDDELETEVTSNTTVTFVLDDCPDLTPTATNTTTVGPAATIVVSSPQNSLGCGATAIVTITVRDSAGKAVPAGALVNIVADKGSVSPTAGQTTADGSVFVFYTAPNNAGGEATITAASGSALGSTEIDINCNIAPTQPPPPTSDVGSGGIQPPNTGDGGLATGNGWHTYAGIALILSSVITTLAVIRPRA